MFGVLVAVPFLFVGFDVILRRRASSSGRARSMENSGMLPRWFDKLHPRYRTPSNAILLIGGLSVITPLFGRQTLVWLVDAGGFAIIIAYIMVAVTFLVLRHREPDIERPLRVGPARG
ncbi:MAG: amino acid permease [Pseudonocardiaceae bacterium]